ncbi:Ethylene receptor 2 [Hibiscus syriacus]|uniref:Ethylene receptor n=1 Tax=Hibiscus syriacus TaxID=106335 RepID=A0A6A3CF10_HIBSY|nr:protein EIN4-like [Hibiscus syriacus]KAE8725822.1 Ethylene receptor 2 [Hibiscus syriacus]
MLRALALGLLISLFAVSVSGTDHEFAICNCDVESFWSVHSILECQKVSDFFIAVAYFSIPIELLYFISCSNVPFKWVLVQFIAFIVLCGLTHLLNAWTYYGPHSFQLMLSLTIAKLLTALVSCATAITLLTLIPLLLKVKVREVFLRQNVLELDQEVDMMKRKKEASSHVRMLTQEIRKSLDKHTILYTTLVELSKTLDLINCAVWMPNENRTQMNLTHELKASSSRSFHQSISMNDPDVKEIKGSEGVRILRQDSALGLASGSDEAGSIAAIRMPMLQGYNFKGGTPELVKTRYAILVLVLPINSRNWSYPEMEIVEVVADQVAVALSHAAVLEESQQMREKLSQQNHVLQQERQNAMMASQARNSFQKVMSHGMKRPMHSILGLLSVFQDENMNFKQKILVDTLVKTSSVLSTLINDVMEISAKDHGRFPFEMRPFSLHSMIKETSCLAKCLSVYKGFGFEVGVQSSLPDQVIGDEKKTFQVILHMVGYLLGINSGGGTVLFRVLSDSGSQEKNDKINAWRSNIQDYLFLKIEIGIHGGCSVADAPVSAKTISAEKHNKDETKESLNFTMCKKIVQMMQGNVWISTNSLGFAQSMTLLLRFQIQSYIQRITYAHGDSAEQSNSYSRFRGLRVLLAADDDINRIVTKKLLEKLGCEVTAVSTGFECLSAVSHAENSFRIVVLDLHMPEMDGFEVAMRIRKFRSRNWPLIIALTASAEDHVRERCLQIGMNAVLQKPVLLQGMADELRRVLQRTGEGV